MKTPEPRHHRLRTRIAKDKSKYDRKAPCQSYEDDIYCNKYKWGDCECKTICRRGYEM
jgi:hypothetical protein